MKYRLLKQIERESIPIGDTFEGGTVFVTVIDSIVPEIANGEVDVFQLFDLGYIEPIYDEGIPVHIPSQPWWNSGPIEEELKRCSRAISVAAEQMGPSKILDEGERAPFVIGSPFVLQIEGHKHPRFMVVNSIWNSEYQYKNPMDNIILNGEWSMSNCRKPTFEELRKFYSPSFWR